MGCHRSERAGVRGSPQGWYLDLSGVGGIGPASRGRASPVRKLTPEVSGASRLEGVILSTVRNLTLWPAGFSQDGLQTTPVGTAHTVCIRNAFELQVKEYATNHSLSTKGSTFSCNKESGGK